MLSIKGIIVGSSIYTSSSSIFVFVVGGVSLNFIKLDVGGGGGAGVSITIGDCCDAELGGETKAVDVVGALFGLFGSDESD